MSTNSYLIFNDDIKITRIKCDSVLYEDIVEASEQKTNPKTTTLLYTKYSSYKTNKNGINADYYSPTSLLKGNTYMVYRQKYGNDYYDFVCEMTGYNSLNDYNVQANQKYHYMVTIPRNVNGTTQYYFYQNMDYYTKENTDYYSEPEFDDVVEAGTEYYSDKECTTSAGHVLKKTVCAKEIIDEVTYYYITIDETKYYVKSSDVQNYKVGTITDSMVATKINSTYSTIKLNSVQYYVKTDRVTPSKQFKEVKWDTWSICSIEESIDEDNIDDEDAKTLYTVTSNVWTLGLNMEEPTITQNMNVVSWDTLSKYPRFSTGQRNYQSSSFTSLLGRVQEWEVDNEKTCRYTERDLSDEDRIEYSSEIDKMRAWREFISDGELKLLKDNKGNSWVVYITDTPTLNMKTMYNEIPTVISFNWKEAEDVSDVSIVTFGG